MSHKRRLRRHYGVKVAIAGGTGTLGRQVASELQNRGHDIRILSRNAPEYRVNLATGEGLEDAVAGCEVVIDTSNNSSRNAAATLVEGSRRLLSAARAAGVAHHVCVSIVGCERVPVGYFQVKAQQEEVVEHGRVPWTIVRATQFHEYAAATLESAARWRIIPVPQLKLQTVSSAEVARVIADAAEDGPRRTRVEIAGPEVTTARELARTWRHATGRRLALVPVRLVVLERLSPAERTAFVLHDVFDVDFEEIAEVVGRTPSAVRQLASRARKHVRAGQPRFPPTRAEQAEIVTAFAAACANGDIDQLTRLLDPGVTWRADGGGKVTAAPVLAHGAHDVAQLLLGFAGRGPAHVRMVLVNGAPGLVVRDAGQVLSVIALTVDGGRITAIDIIRDPDKLSSASGLT